MTTVDVTLVPQEEPLPFVFRFTDKDGADVVLEVGDAFELLSSFTGEDAMIHQIGLRMVMMGLKFLGHTDHERQLIGALALKGAK